MIHRLLSRKLVAHVKDIKKMAEADPANIPMITAIHSHFTVNSILGANSDFRNLANLRESYILFNIDQLGD